MKTLLRYHERCGALALVSLGLFVAGMSAHEVGARSGHERGHGQDQLRRDPEASADAAGLRGQAKPVSLSAGEPSGGMAIERIDAPPNDDCENAIDLTAPGGPCEDLEAGCVVPFSNEGATTDGPDHGECPGLGSDIWFKLHIGGGKGLSQGPCETSFPPAPRTGEPLQLRSGSGSR